LLEAKNPCADAIALHEQAQWFMLSETLPSWVDEVIIYQDDHIYAMIVPRLFPGGFGGTSVQPIVEKLLMRGFFSGKKVDIPI
jgi:hypothetical protein